MSLEQLTQASGLAAAPDEVTPIGVRLALTGERAALGLFGANADECALLRLAKVAAGSTGSEPSRDAVHLRRAVLFASAAVRTADHLERSAVGAFLTGRRAAVRAGRVGLRDDERADRESRVVAFAAGLKPAARLGHSAGSGRRNHARLAGACAARLASCAAFLSAGRPARSSSSAIAGRTCGACRAALSRNAGLRFISFFPAAAAQQRRNQQHSHRPSVLSVTEGHKLNGGAA
jgi:hypothetical protein